MQAPDWVCLGQIWSQLKIFAANTQENTQTTYPTVRLCICPSMVQALKTLCVRTKHPPLSSASAAAVDADNTWKCELGFCRVCAFCVWAHSYESGDTPTLQSNICCQYLDPLLSFPACSHLLPPLISWRCCDSMVLTRKLHKCRTGLSQLYRWLKC